jgi:uncharacterized membrane protein YqiK
MTDVEKLEFENKLLADEVKRLREELEKEKEYKQKVFDTINKDHALMGLLMVSLNIQNFLEKSKEGQCKCE